MRAQPWPSAPPAVGVLIVMNEATFYAALDRALQTLRARLLADVEAAARNDAARGGIRSDWRAHVHQLALLRRRLSSQDATTPRPTMGRDHSGTADRC
jgi:hypothetical protein